MSLGHESSVPQKKFEKSHCSVAQVHHHEQVGAGGHPAALASLGGLNVNQFFLQNHKYGAIYMVSTLECIIFDILLMIFLKVLFAI